VRTGWACAAALVVVIAASRDADAFCRTTTMPLPSGYDPTVQGCWTQGHPISWLPDERVNYELDAAASTQIALADATRAADNAFARWNAVQCNGGSPNVVAVDDGPISAAAFNQGCKQTPCEASGTHHVIVFRDKGWEYDDPSNTLALTTVTYGIDSAVLLNAEIEVNSHDHKLSTSDPPADGAYDLQTILTHEAGHFFGLAHATSEHSVMYAYYSSDARELTADDVAGMCAAYPPLAAEPGFGCGVGSLPSRGGGRVAGVSALLALALLRRSRAASRRHAG
jgi:hypothetical protein